MTRGLESEFEAVQIQPEAARGGRVRYDKSCLRGLSSTDIKKRGWNRTAKAMPRLVIGQGARTDRLLYTLYRKSGCVMYKKVSCKPQSYHNHQNKTSYDGRDKMRQEGGKGNSDGGLGRKELSCIAHPRASHHTVRI